MFPLSLLPEDIIRADGVGPRVDVSQFSGQLLVLTLSINRTIEQTSLAVSAWGSKDGVDWGTKPMASFTQKSYCGLYSTLLNLAAAPDLKYVRVQWKVNRLSKFTGTPLFGFAVGAEKSGARVQAAVA